MNQTGFSISDEKADMTTEGHEVYPALQKPAIVFEHVTKRYGNFVALDNVSFAVKTGELFSFLGPSGSGKTTILRILGGFEEPEEGSVYIFGNRVNGIPPHKRKNVNTVFQNYALFPHMNVFENIAYGLRVDGVKRDAVKERVKNMLKLMKLEEWEKSEPHHLSGGMKQRVALARALIKEPEVLLLDEPLSALDLKIRQHLLIELKNLHERIGSTFIYVTHDQGEALSISDRILILDRGNIVQIGTPVEIYENPSTRFSAEFIGDMNFIDGTVIRSETDKAIVKIDSVGEVIVISNGGISEGDNITVSVRPERVVLHKDLEKADALNCVAGKLVETIYEGSVVEYIINLENGLVVTAEARGGDAINKFTVGDPLYFCWMVEDAIVLKN
ncbi:MAG: ABC transporter ATP-binding protein [Thermodesulfobacteriota bacterium]